MPYLILVRMKCERKLDKLRSAEVRKHLLGCIYVTGGYTGRSHPHDANTGGNDQTNDTDELRSLRVFFSFDVGIP